MKVKRKMLALFGTLAIILGGTLIATADPALAVISCPSHALCTYADANFGGAMYYYTPPSGTASGGSDGLCVNIGAAWNDRISSYVNNAGVHSAVPYGYSAKFWPDSNCGGSSLNARIADYGSSGNMSALTNDVASSLRWYYSGSPY